MQTPLKRPTEAWASTDVLEGGFGHVIVARFKANGDCEAGVFLVDAGCLGVKDAFFAQVAEAEYDHRLLARLLPEGDRKPLSPACARKFVEGAVAYARSLGLEPHADYKRGARVFGGIDATACDQVFVYGKDGKPLFVQSPNDTPEFARHVMNTLNRRLGPDGWHFIILAGGSGIEE